MPPARALVRLAPAALLACGSGPSDGFSSMGPGITSASAGTHAGSTSSGDAGSTSTTSASSTSPADASSTSEAAGSTATPGVYDLGTNIDVGSGKPPGCDDKIDFLFVMQQDSKLPENRVKFIAAFPDFIDTIQDRFAGFDVHIMVVDSDWDWGIDDCEEEGCLATNNNGCKIGDYFIPDYPCGIYYSEIMKDPCNLTLGAGVTFNAGYEAANVPCKLDGGRRYITQDQTDLKETFACMASVGQNGGLRVGRPALKAVSPKLNAEGGCNAGFLRDDALLMITWMATGDDLDSEGTPQDWADAIFAAKHGNKDAVIMLGIGGDEDDPPSARLLQFLARFPLSVREYIGAASYGPAFAKAVTLIDEACQGFVPPG